jgi:hypothetical protein
VFYRIIWNIVGKYSILCCDTNPIFSILLAYKSDLSIQKTPPTEQETTSVGGERQEPRST